MPRSVGAWLCVAALRLLVLLAGHSELSGSVGGVGHSPMRHPCISETPYAYLLLEPVSVDFPVAVCARKDGDVRRML